MKRRKFLSSSKAVLLAPLLPTSFITKKIALPKVLLLGDSISIGYTPFVQEMLEGRAEVTRPMLSLEKAENCAGTTKGVQSLDRWLGKAKYDIIHFNFGLHDIKHVDPATGENSDEPAHPRQAEPKKYRKNLKLIVKKLKETGADLIFATTTPYPAEKSGPLRDFGDEIIYNKIARKIMIKNQITINDLHAYVLPRADELMRPANVHFTEKGSKMLAQEVVKHISAKL